MKPFWINKQKTERLKFHQSLSNPRQPRKIKASLIETLTGTARDRKIVKSPLTARPVTIWLRFQVRLSRASCQIIEVLVDLLLRVKQSLQLKKWSLLALACLKGLWIESIVQEMAKEAIREDLVSSRGIQKKRSALLHFVIQSTSKPEAVNKNGSRSFRSLKIRSKMLTTSA